ncbi:MAG: hypothetical protein AB1414_08820 [bacterium]
MKKNTINILTALIVSLFFIGLTTTPSNATGWPDLKVSKVKRPEGVNQPLPPLPPVPTKVVMSDPDGDSQLLNFNNPSGAVIPGIGTPTVDVVQLEAGIGISMGSPAVTVRLTFNQWTNISTVVGCIGLDTDQNRYTGWPFWKYPEIEVGFDYMMNLLSLPTVSIYDVNGTLMGQLTAVLGTQTIEVTIPLWMLGGDDGIMDLEMVLGILDFPTDLAPPPDAYGAHSIPTNPVLRMFSNKEVYTTGDTLNANVKVLNNGPTMTVDVHIYVQGFHPSPVWGQVPLIVLNNVTIPTGFNTTVPVISYPITPTSPKGITKLGARICDPITGDILSDGSKLIVIP